MHNSPTRSAFIFALSFGLLAGAWVTFTHMGPTVFMVIDEHNVHHDAPADAAFAVLTTVLLFILTRYHFVRQADAQETLRRSNDGLELRVQQRTHALTAEREKLLRILDAMPDGVCIINFRHEIEYANPALVKDWGEIDRRKCYTYFMGRSDPCTQCRKPEILSGSVVKWERTSPDGRRAFELVGTSVRGLNGEDATLQIVRDVTERYTAAHAQKQLLERIDDERHLLQAVVENTPASIALFDGTHRRIKWVNRRYHQTLTGHLQNTDLTGLTVNDVYPANIRDKVQDIFQQVLDSGLTYSNPEFQCQLPGAEGTFWDWSLLPLPAEADRTPDLLLVAHEITDQVLTRKRIEEMSFEAEHRAEELRKAHTELSSQTRELAALLAISQNVASTLLTQPLLDVVLEQIKRVVDYETAVVYTLEDSSLVAVACHGESAGTSWLGLHIPLTHAPGFKAVLDQRTPVIIDDLGGTTPLGQALIAAAETHFPQTLAGARSWMGVPLSVNDRVIGMMRLDHSQPGHFSPHAAQLALAIANQAAVAMENLRLYEEARKVATLEERQRMARELHDSVSQALYGIALGTHAAREQLERAPQKLDSTLDYILAMSATAVAEMRALVFELRPESLEQEGLIAALTRQADAVRARAGIVLRSRLCMEPPASLDAKEAIYRIAQEALQNIVKHAHAHNVLLSLRLDGERLVLEVTDDGTGFNPDERFPGHFGMSTMKERAHRLDGTLDITSQAGVGTIVSASIPTGRPPIESNGKVPVNAVIGAAA